MDATAQATNSKSVPTACGMCYVGCGIRVQVENGVAVNIEGNPESPQNRGKMCAKGKAGIMNLYNPHRVKVPLKRTNPEKGLNVDPGWQEISWDEALDTIVAAARAHPRQPEKALDPVLGIGRRQHVLVQGVRQRLWQSPREQHGLADLRQGGASGGVLLRRRLPSAAGSALRQVLHAGRHPDGCRNARFL